ncbi:uncharacterized protein [Rutidosis leptorrhynchoides]|uniref:uncharacterized protein n=1 Tax=Rutidosis leptorrhynchoides TaxID=125765 RepID=UPI003A98DD70
MITAAAAQAQNTTDPAEVRVINEMFSQWGISESSVTNMGWNISGELCSGAAVDSTDFDAQTYNPAIKCDCAIRNSTYCHITRLKVYAMDAVGPIPEGLWTLIYLTNLNIGQNYLTGPLSPSIGNLTRMQWMTLGINALSGELPPELGRLTDLRSLAIGTNSFNGSLPSELGNLRRLEQLYIDSSGLGGEIPSTFANLQSLATVWASDNAFTGRIPDFIGNWTQLTSLRFEGNSFEGSIPALFSQLTSLQELRITGLSNQTLDFITNLKSLAVLVLRNNRITGRIPTNIGEFTNLTRLDLSFNNMTGPIPEALFNLSQINFLFLGNNSLNGTLPAVKSASLTNIDLSYNELSGTLPSWVNEQSLQLNLVVNNFTLDGSDNSGIPAGLNCLQRDFACNRGSPRYSNFGVNCGGPQITSSDQIVHEQDNEALGPSTYYLTSERRWGVSNVGQRDNPVYTASSSRQFTNTLDSELFQTARLSAGSLRYYGLGLENGNYTVNLQFAELQIQDGRTWRSTGRRIFDIYLQGNLVFPDFDIKQAAGGASFSPVSRQATVQVSNNYLEIHLFWSGKGTCCVPDQGTFGPLISAISATPNFTPTVSNNPPSTKKNSTGLIVGIVVPIIVVSFLSLLAFYIFRQRRKRQGTSDDYEEFEGIDARPYTFSYGDLRDATGDFSPENKLGEGGFGPVYKGTLADMRVIAVKQLSIASHQGKSQFIAEIATISAVQHRNLVKLYGCCIDGEKRLLVYEYLENKSLDQALFGNKSLSLNWSTRFDICIGVARGLAYLHEESRIRVVHRDVKASNVLLDSDLNPKISDFGLAKLYDDKKTHMSTRVAGTIGYLAPEYAMRGHLTEKADVFGFGVVALEIISGRSNTDSALDDDRIYLLEWAWNLHEADTELELVDEKLSEYDENEVRRVMKVALLCTQTSPMQRPPMSRVVAMLSGDIEATGVITRPEYLTGFKFNDATTFKSDTQVSTTDSAATTSYSAPSPRSPNNASRPMLHDIIKEVTLEHMPKQHKMFSKGLFFDNCRSKSNLEGLGVGLSQESTKNLFLMYGAYIYTQICCSTAVCKYKLSIILMAVPTWSWSGLWLWLMISVKVAQAQTSTDPSEVRVINEMFSQWGIQESSVTAMRWNISGEPCSGSAIDSTDFESPSFNPALKCNCRLPNSTYCHITQIKVLAMDATGPIPEGLWTLTYLVNLNLNQNYLTGPLSPSIGNLNQMQWITFGGNALSGKVPPELGLLTDLRSLAFDTNNFSGSLPFELGNLIKLQLLYIDSSGVSGEIPSTFANLKNLVTVRASDNKFTGKIPDFIGNWSLLQSLRFEGNTFEGSIPPSFSQLTSMQDLRISGLSNGTLDFMKDLKSLSVLSLRNNRISGSIPTDIGEYQKLTRLCLLIRDLSFNNLTGPMPRELFNLSQISFFIPPLNQMLIFRFLGNNSLTGTVPDIKSGTLQNIDLSYNELSGMLPSWVNEPNLQLNLVVNNFNLGGSGNSGVPSGLDCLQRNFPCGRGSPRYSEFAINCGGPQITSSSQIVNDQENEALGPATYYVTSDRRWGVSNVGQRDNPVYTAFIARPFTNTLDSQLFQTARISAGSLRYYGLGLENGNYTVNLQFAELKIEDGPTWRSHGRRIFDIYLQGNLVFPDFDIKQAAGGASFSPVSRQATVLVSSNYLEIHLFWSGKGSCCVPEQGTFGPLISAISVTPNFNPTVSNTSPSTKQNRTSLIVWILVPIAVVGFMSILAIYFFLQRRKRQNTVDNYAEFVGTDNRPNTFSYGDLRDATNDFSSANKLGEGGFGPVYKGTLGDGKLIAVKKLSVASHQGMAQFMAEIATISAVQHRNLVKLYGCCIDGEERLLVYEYLENKSLDQALFGKNRLSLNWSTRFDICLGIARGLAYLHEESRMRIVHRDVKASNVLLDSDLNPKISDFGLAKLYDDKKTHMSTRVAGTFGYLAPEYAMRGHLTEKADVFAFGVVALEIISGRPNSDSSLEDDKMYLLNWAWDLHEANSEVELVDDKLCEFDENEVRRVMRVALLCIQTSPVQRPSMSRVVAMLSGDIEAAAAGVITRPGYLAGFDLTDTTTFKSTLSTSVNDHGSKTSSRPILHDISGQGR